MNINNFCDGVFLFVWESLEQQQQKWDFGNNESIAFTCLKN